MYSTLNDLLLLDIPSDVHTAIEEIFYNAACICSVEFAKIIAQEGDINLFLNNFNSIWKNIEQNFSLLRKILIKFEKKFYGQTLQQSNVFYICNLIY